jgi:hypothetical protein
MMALSGVRISWLMLARNSDFADDACSAWRLASRRSASVFFHCVMSRKMAQRVAAAGDPADGHEQRNHAALAPAADHLAAVVEHARDAGLVQPFR